MKTITLKVSTKFGPVNVEFEILKQIGCDRYLLWAQDRICVGKALSANKWIISESVDLFAVPVTEEIHVINYDPANYVEKR